MSLTLNFDAGALPTAALMTLLAAPDAVARLADNGQGPAVNAIKADWSQAGGAGAQTVKQAPIPKRAALTM